MPQELLSFPPYYVVVGLYRLLTSATIRDPVWAKVRHGTVRGLIFCAIFFALTWIPQKWFVGYWLMRKGRDVVAKKEGGGIGLALGWLRRMDKEDFNTLVFMLPQLTTILHYCLRHNLRIARERAWTLTVASRNKPAEFWSKGYIEEWETPPTPRFQETGAYGRTGLTGEQQDKYLKLLLSRPAQMVIRHLILLPLSPYLPILATLVVSGLRALHTARTLHRPYFEVKRMTPQEVEIWLEERKSGYRAFGFAAAVLESIPILGLLFSVSNRVGAAMWAFDFEKRQHRFASGELKPLRSAQSGFVPPPLPPRKKEL